MIETPGAKIRENFGKSKRSTLGSSPVHSIVNVESHRVVVLFPVVVVVVRRVVVKVILQVGVVIFFILIWVSQKSASVHFSVTSLQRQNTKRDYFVGKRHFNPFHPTGPFLAPK